MSFIIFHQPKTGGTYAKTVLPNNYVLGHYHNYHYCLTHNYNLNNKKLVCIIREPLDYYISLITFWCLDPEYCKIITTNTIEKLTIDYNKKIINNDVVGHPNYWMSNGFTERNIINILTNLFSDEFIKNNINKLSINHHTYNNYVFSILSKLDIGYYTFAFLDQYSRKKVSEIKTTEECKEEIIYIKNNFIILNNKYLTEQLKELCDKFNVPFKNSNKKMVSNRNSIEDYNINIDLINKIKYKERYILEIFKDIYEQ
jgi:hypothetical protein